MATLNAHGIGVDAAARLGRRDLHPRAPIPRIMTPQGVSEIVPPIAHVANFALPPGARRLRRWRGRAHGVGRGLHRPARARRRRGRHRAVRGQGHPVAARGRRLRPQQPAARHRRAGRAASGSSSSNGRPFCLYVVIGSHRLRATCSSARSTPPSPASPSTEPRPWAPSTRSTTGAWPTPRGSGARRPRRIHWDATAGTVLDDSQPALLPVVPRGSAQHLLQRPRPLGRRWRRRRRAAGRPAGADPRQPGHRHGRRPTPTGSCATWSPGSPGRWPASASEQGDRVVVYMPMVPEAAVAMLACARLGAVHSVVFGGLRAPRARHPHRRRPAQGRGVGELRHRGLAGHRVQAAARPGHRPGRVERAPSTASSSSAPRPRPRWSTGRDLDWAEAMAAAEPHRLRRRWRPPTRSTCSTPRAPRASPRAWCATTAATPWRCAGACRNVYDVQPGEVFWAASDVGWVVGHSYIVYAPAAVGLHDRALRGQAGRHARPGRVLAGGGRARGVGAVHRAHRAAGHQEGGRRRAPTSPATTCRALRALFLAGERTDPDTYDVGRRPARHPGDRPLVADRDGLGGRRQLPRHRAPPGEGGLTHPAGARATASRSSTRWAAEVEPGRDGVDRRASCRCRPGSLPTLWNDDARFVVVVPVDLRRATTSPATAAASTTTATCS